VCPEIRETIMAGLRKASVTLHYSNSVPRDAFLCCEHSDSTTSPHATVVDSSRTVMTCSRNPAEVCTILTEQHLVWFGSSGASGEWLTPPVIILPTFSRCHMYTAWYFLDVRDKIVLLFHRMW